MKKQILASIFIPIGLIGLIVSILIYVAGTKHINYVTEINQRLLMDSFISSIKTNQNSDDLQSALLPIMNNYTKNFGVSYLMIVDYRDVVIAHSSKKISGKIIKNEFTSKILSDEKRLKNIITTPEDIIEIGEPIRINKQKTAAIIGISQTEIKFQKIFVLYTALGTFFSLLLVGAIANNFLYKRISSSFNKFIVMCKRVSESEKINENEFNIEIGELGEGLNYIKKISQDQQILNEKINYLKIDNITGLFNSQFMLEQLQYELNRSNRYKRPLSCIIVELKNLKQIYSICGIAEGEYILKEIAGLIKGNLRKVDIPGVIDFAAFVIVLPEIQSSQAQIVADRLLKLIKDYKITHNNKSINIVANLGINAFQSEKSAVDGNVFIYQTKQAVHNAELAGENQIYIYSN